MHNLDPEERRGSMPYFPWHLQGLPTASTPEAMNYLLNELVNLDIGIGVKIDPEHWQMTANLGVSDQIDLTKLNGSDKAHAALCGYLIDQGQRNRYTSRTLPEALALIQAPVPGIDLPGFVNNPIAIQDGRVTRIPETLPLIFDQATMAQVEAHYRSNTGQNLDPATLDFAFDNHGTREQIGREVLTNARATLESIARRSETTWANIEFKGRAGDYDSPHWQQLLITSMASLRWLENSLS